jgi:hypothetical protein
MYVCLVCRGSQEKHADEREAATTAAMPRRERRTATARVKFISGANCMAGEMSHELLPRRGPCSIA